MVNLDLPSVLRPKQKRHPMNFLEIIYFDSEKDVTHDSSSVIFKNAKVDGKLYELVILTDGYYVECYKNADDTEPSAIYKVEVSITRNP